MHRRSAQTRLMVAVAALAVLTLVRPSQLLRGQQVDADSDRAGQFAVVRERARQLSQVRVIVSLRLDVESPDSSLTTPAGLQLRREAVAAAQTGVIDALEGLAVAQLRRFEFTPGMAMTIGGVAIDRLEAHPGVVAIKEDALVEPMLDVSVPLVQADRVVQLGTTGDNIAIAILDTGVDKNHPDLAGRVVSEACFSTTNNFLASSSLCPAGAPSSTVPGAGEDCSSSVSGCDHGTHVASIAAAVAPQADIIAIQVFSRRDDGLLKPCDDANKTSPCVNSFESDQIAGLNRVVALSGTRTIAAVNMSLGGGVFAGPCDASFTTLRDTVALLRALGIAVVVSAGNDGFRNLMSAPACLSNVISVGATNDLDQVATFSNITNLTTVLAPGRGIFAAVPQDTSSTTPTRATKSGTSMAAPHVAGVFALLRQELRGVATGSIVSELTTRIRTSGPAITDQRPGGLVHTIRRVDAFNALCGVVNCDADDFRGVLDSVTPTIGTITTAGDRDFYTYTAAAGDRITVRVNQRTGTLDPVLEVRDASGQRIAIDDNGGDGNNALVSGLALPRAGAYLLVVRDAGTTGRTGAYSLTLSRDPLATYPVPRITNLEPASVTATVFGADFWLAVRGFGFTRETQARWDGADRAVYYSGPTLIYIRVLARDVVFPAPRTPLVMVRNPTPGGGLNAVRFSITSPILGTFELLQPTVRHTPVGVPVTFEGRWVTPGGLSWRTMQRMDMRLANDAGDVAAWIRVVERPGTASVLRLINAAGAVVGEGLPGANTRLDIPGIVSLDLAASTFVGSGDTAVLRPVVTFGPDAAGVYDVRFEVDNEAGVVQADDILGIFRVLPPGCVELVEDLIVNGPTHAAAGATVTLTALLSPVTTSSPVDYVWAPQPLAGQGTAVATYRWASGGVQPVNVTVTNCGGFAAAGTQVVVPASSLLAEGATGWFFDMDVLVANPHDEDVPYTLTYLTPAGKRVMRDLAIPSRSRQTIRVNDDRALAGESAVSTVVTVPSGLPLAVERTMFWDQATHYGGHGGSAVQAPARRWYFAEGSQGFFDTWLLLANPGEAPATMQVTFLREHEAPYAVAVTVPAGARETIWAGSHAALAGRSFSIEVDADSPVMAERAMYWSSPGRYWSGGHDSAGVSELSTFWFLAEGATGDYFDMYVLLGNPGADATTATVTFLLADGTTVDRTYDVPARRRLTINVEDQDPRLRQAEVSVRVVSGEPIVVERAMYWPGNSSTWQDAHNSFGVTDTGLAWMLAEGRAGTPSKYETFVLIANPSSAQSAEVTLTFLAEAGPPIVRTTTVQPNSRFTVWASAIPELANTNFGVLVESTNEVPIVVERAMYWDAVGQHWAAGINTTGTRLR